MSLKTVRVCDECGGESLEKGAFYVVKLYRSDPALPHTLDEMHKEVCSYGCVAAATDRWIGKQR